MKLEGYIAKQIKAGLYEPGDTGENRVLLIIETENDFPTIAPLTETDINNLVSELNTRRRELWPRSIFRWFRERWQTLKNKQTRL